MNTNHKHIPDELIDVGVASWFTVMHQYLTSSLKKEERVIIQ